MKLKSKKRKAGKRKPEKKSIEMFDICGCRSRAAAGSFSQTQPPPIGSGLLVVFGEFLSISVIFAEFRPKNKNFAARRSPLFTDIHCYSPVLKK